MTQTGIIIAAYDLTHLAHLSEVAHQDYLDLIGWAKQELDALAAGMHNQTPAQRALQNESWSTQSRALQQIVEAALRAGVEADAIQAITWRESW